MQLYLHAIGISEPYDVTICEGKSKNITCTLNKIGGKIDLMEVQWYRFIKDASKKERVYPSGGNISFIRSTINNTTVTTSLTITNAKISYTGYYWVGPLDNYTDDCKNISLTVTTSTYVYAICCVFKIDVFLLN